MEINVQIMVNVNVINENPEHVQVPLIVLRHKINERNTMIEIFKNNFAKLNNIEIDNKEYNERFNKQREIANEIYNKLIISPKERMLPVYEMLMGSGKSSIITPLIMISLLSDIYTNQNPNKNFIILCMPETLIIQSFHSLINYLIPVVRTNIYIYNVTLDSIKFGNKKNHIMYDIPKLSILLMNDTSFKTIFIKNYHITDSQHTTYSPMDPRTIPDFFDFPENVQQKYIENYDRAVEFYSSPENLKILKDKQKETIQKNPNSQNSFVIYDEIDSLANPLTCELNFESSKSSLDFPRLTMTIMMFIFKLFFRSKQDKLTPEAELFWKQNEINSHLNVYHNYIKEYSKSKIAIDNYINTINIDLVIEHVIKNNPSHNYYVNDIKTVKQAAVIIISYIKKKIMTFVLTSQCTYQYGIPNKDNIFKAIPYSGIDNPVYGSEFSDPLLTMFLTYMSYKFTGITRKYDKREFLNMIASKRNFTIFDKIKPLIKKQYKLIEIKQFIKFIIRDMDDITDNELVDYYFIEAILPNLTGYNKGVENISFTEMLMPSNVPDFVGFTGTPYIFFPTDHDERAYPNYKPNNYNPNMSIETKYSESIVKQNGQMYKLNSKLTIELCICRAEYLWKVNANNYINETIDIIATKNYDCLIDTAGIFIGCSQISDACEGVVNLLAKKLDRTKFDYIAYFENDKLAYHISSGKTLNLAEISGNKVFFYFSNSKITGIDVKMKLTAKGLATLSFSSRLRDIAQGIFRMRQIMLDQRCDFIVSDKDIINIENNEECNLESICNKCEDTQIKRMDVSLRRKIYNFLENNEKIYNKNQYILFLEQNLKGITRTSYGGFSGIHYIQPVEYPDTDFIFDKYLSDRYEQIFKNDNLAKQIYEEFSREKTNLTTALMEQVSVQEQEQDRRQNRRKNKNNRRNKKRL